MQTIFPKAMTRMVGLALTLVVSGLLWVLVPGQASAGFCSATKCGLTLTSGKAVGGGNGDVSGAIGSADNPAGSLTSRNFKNGGLPSSLYQGVRNSAPGCTTSDCQGSLFGYANDNATGGPQRPQNLQDISLTVSPAASAADIPQLLRNFTPPRRNSPPSSVAGGCLWWERTRNTCGSAGPLLPATPVPEPGSLAVLASGLLALGFLRWKRVI